MASNLNKAFMRAYAKDRQPMLGGDTANASDGSLASQFENAAAVESPSVAAPHYVASQAKPTLVPEAIATLQSARAHHRPKSPTPAGQETAAQAAVADASAVWQRIDEAQAYQPPHVTNPPSRPVMSIAGVGSAAGPKRMQTAVAAPVEPPTTQAPTGGLLSHNQTELPLAAEQATSDVGTQNLDARRRTVADFLYSAGQYSATQNLARPNPATVAGAMAQAAPRQFDTVHPAVQSAAPAANLGNMTGASTVPVRSTAPVMTSASATTNMAVSPGYKSAAVQMPLPVPVRRPVVEPIPPALAPAGRVGQILRVDVPRSTHKVASSGNTSSGSPSETRQTSANQQQEKLDPPAARYVLEQRRMDRAHELGATEEKLRRYKHRIFNPVWEVDSLQWPSVVDKLMQHRADSMAQVAAHLKTACEDGLSVLGVSSADQGEGRTTVACCLARLAAAHGLNVVLVDLDLDHPTLCIQTNMEIEHDWRDCLTGDATLEEVSVHSIDDQLTLLPLKPRGGRPGLLASDSRITDMLDQLTESFELVVVDCARMNSSGNVISGLAHAEIFDAAILVVDRRDSHQDRVEDAIRAIQQTGIESIGIVDNFSM